MVIKEIQRVVKFICCVEFLRMSVLWTLSLLISYLRLFGRCLWVPNPKATTTNLRQSVAAPTSVAMTPVCIITGATSGLGAAAAHALAKEGFFVVLVGRSGHKLAKTMSEIRELDSNAQLEAFEVDISSFTSVIKFGDSIQRWLLDMNLHSSIQLLINNAGILATSYKVTADGFDEMMMTNYMGAFCLTKVDEEFVSGRSFSNSKQYPFARIYGYSKLCMVLFSYELHRQIKIIDKASHLSVNVADPGAVKTNIMREVPSCLAHLAFGVLKLLGLLQNPEDGVSSVLDAALAPPGTSGMYFFGGKGRTLSSSTLSYDANLAERLWKISSDLLLNMKLPHEKSLT